MKLSEIQQQFASRLPYLTAEIARQGYDWTTGHALRCEDCPVGSASSKHKRKLAIDINLFKDGVYLTSTEDHRPIGEYWQSLGGIWGGDFNDGNHYEWHESGVENLNPLPSPPKTFEAEVLSALLSIEELLWQIEAKL